MENKILHTPHEGVSGANTATEKNTVTPTQQQNPLLEGGIGAASVAPQGTPWALSAQHREMLEQESGISPEAIKARGYFTLPAGKEGREWLRGQGFNQRQQILGECLVMPFYNRIGEITEYVLRPSEPRTDAKGKAIKYEKAGGSRQSLDIAPLTLAMIGDPTVPLIITEGAKKADSAASRGLPAINLHGTFAFRGRNDKGGIANLPEWDEIVLKGNIDGKLIAREVFLAFDSDWVEKDGVYDALIRLGAALKYRGARVRMVDLPCQPSGDKMGLDDFFAGGGTVEETLHLIRELPTKPDRTVAQKQRAIEKKERARECPSITIDGCQLPEVMKELYEAIVKANSKNPASPRLYRGAGGPSVVEKDKDNQFILKTVSVPHLRFIAAEMAIWHSSRGEAWPSKDLMEIFLANFNQFPLPAIARVVSAPFYRADGTLCAMPGYDAQTQTFLALPKDFVLADIEPTEENLAVAHDFLVEDILGEVAFRDDASRAHAIALMILPLVRLMIDGATPFHLFEAAQQSSGKSYAASLAIAPYERPTSVTDTRKDEEWDKALLSAFVLGRPVIFVDNITSNLGSPALASYITEPTKTGRLLGGNVMATVETRGVTWVGTANNATLSADIISRMLKIRIDPRMEEPAEREFKSDAWTYVQNNRAEVIGALVTLVEAWKVAGEPEFTSNKHRFDRWSRVMGGILQVAGISGFLDNLKSERLHNDTSREAWSGFVGAWFEEFGDDPVTAKQVFTLANAKCDDFMALLGGREDSQVQRLGSLLLKQRERVFGVDGVGEFTIARQEQKTNKGVLWELIYIRPSANPKAQPSHSEGDEGEKDQAKEIPEGENSTGGAETGDEGQGDEEQDGKGQGDDDIGEEFLRVIR